MGVVFSPVLMPTFNFVLSVVELSSLVQMLLLDTPSVVAVMQGAVTRT